MAVTEKYYGTFIIINGDTYNKLKELGYSGTHRQFRIVCKAKSMTEASRKAKVYGLGDNVFKSDYTSETGNELEIEMVDKYGFIISLDGVRGCNFVALDSIV